MRGLRWILFIAFFLPLSALAELQVLFNPYDPTLEKIGEWIKGSHSSIDMALYNIDISSTNPVIKALQSPEVQRRVQSGHLKMRLIFEGYEDRPIREAIMKYMESLGVEVRELRSSVKMHHKFAVFDINSPRPRVVSGSGNWSLSSQRNYNENAFFMAGEPLSGEFQNEFDLLWEAAHDFPRIQNLEFDLFRKPIPRSQGSPLNVYFNSRRFKLTKGGIRRNKSATAPRLTDVIIQGIQSAQKEISVATTRLKLEPIYQALIKAVQRGVRVRIIVSQDDYRCHGGQSYSRKLSKEDFPGHENIDVRVKYYHLDPCEYLRNQMHHKYMIVDQSRVYSGSFNWSLSGENNHLENVLEVRSEAYPNSIRRFTEDFEKLWELNRNSYSSLVEKLKNRERICSFHPMALEFTEVDSLVGYGRKLGCRVKKYRKR